jgi:hypothetical protein
MDFLELLAKPMFSIARFLLWLACDLMFETIAWVVGWPVVRLLSFGKFPSARIVEYERAETGEAFITCITGFGVLVAIIWLLARHYGWSW